MHSSSSSSSQLRSIQTHKQRRKLRQIAQENDKKMRNSKTNVMSEVSDEYEVEKIIDKKIEDSIVLFKVKWKGWDSNHNTWEPEGNLFRISEMVKEFEASKKYLKKQGNFNLADLSSSSDLELVNNSFQVDGQITNNSFTLKKIKSHSLKTRSSDQSTIKNLTNVEESSQKHAHILVESDHFQRQKVPSFNVSQTHNKTSNIHRSTSHFTSHKRSERDKYACQSSTLNLQIQTEQKTSRQQAESEYIFHSILDKRQLKGQEIEYLLKFQNHTLPEWEYISNLQNILDDIYTFEKNHKSFLNEKIHKQLDTAAYTLPKQTISLSKQTLINSNTGSQQLQERRRLRQKADMLEQISIEESEEVNVETLCISDSQGQRREDRCEEQSEQEIMKNQISINKSQAKSQLSYSSNPIQIIVSENSPSSISEIGCYYKGDKSISISLVGKELVKDLQNATFLVNWHPRNSKNSKNNNNNSNDNNNNNDNSMVLQPGLISYQMIKTVDPMALINFYENLQGNVSCD